MCLNLVSIPISGETERHFLVLEEFDCSTMRILDRFDRLNYAVIVYILATLFNISQTNEEHPNHDNTNTSSENASNKRISLGPCQLCREMVKSFDKVSMF